MHSLILSIHIPKTAGQSFIRILQQAYGQEQVLHINRGKLIRTKQQLKALSPNRFKVIHGHLPYQEFLSPHNTDCTKIITFLRDPVERVLSNFRYYRRMKDERIKAGKKVRHYHDLQDFIQLEERQNVMTSFLNGLELEALFFLGFQEDFRQDVKLLARKLEWDVPESAYETRKNTTSAATVSDTIRNQISDLNKLDVELYNRARSLKESGYWN